MNLEDIELKLYEYFINTGNKVTKKSLKEIDNTLSYSTLLRKGFSFSKFNEKYGLSTLFKRPNPTCLHCGVVIDKLYNKFCSQSCAASFNNKLNKYKLSIKNIYINTILRRASLFPSDGYFLAIVKNKNLTYKRVPITTGNKINVKYSNSNGKVYCKFCTTLLTRRGQTRFCSISCRAKMEKEIAIEDWKAGRIKPRNQLAYSLLCHEAGNKCSCCGITDWQGKSMRFEVEHKDGNSKNFEYSNYCLLCPNCHSQTSTYKGKNKGRGRYSRSKRYHEGKSY